MSLEYYQEAVQCFQDSVRSWEQADAEKKRLGILIPERPVIEIDKQKIRWIVQSVRNKACFRHPDQGRRVLSEKAQKKWADRVEPKISRAIKAAIAEWKASLEKLYESKLRDYNDAWRAFKDAVDLRDLIRQEILEWVEIVAAESGAILPLLPSIEDHREELAQSDLATRGTLMRRVIVEPRVISADGYTRMLYTKDFTGGSFNGGGFVEFAVPGKLGVAESFARRGHPMDTKDRPDAIVIALDHTKLRHKKNSSKISINSDDLRGKVVRIFRANIETA